VPTAPGRVSMATSRSEERSDEPADAAACLPPAAVARRAGFGLALGLAMLRGPANPKSISLAVQPSGPASGSPHSTTWGLTARNLNLWRGLAVAPLASHDNLNS
jgi:hypothetical protein